ncbi:uncharacterized protein [Macrobrachium rosenbergii]|uniref:uncharacterized protein n=1 Tax=Macrobrachium rosenbergii TaxID=79674 RepID=UPI0034D68490
MVPTKLEEGNKGMVDDRGEFGASKGFEESVKNTEKGNGSDNTSNEENSINNCESLLENNEKGNNDIADDKIIRLQPSISGMEEYTAVDDDQTYNTDNVVLKGSYYEEGIVKSLTTVDVYMYGDLGKEMASGMNMEEDDCEEDTVQEEGLDPVQISIAEKTTATKERLNLEEGIPSDSECMDDSDGTESDDSQLPELCNSSLLSSGSLHLAVPIGTLRPFSTEDSETKELEQQDEEIQTIKEMNCKVLKAEPRENHTVAFEMNIVIYDRWADFSPSSQRQQDIHAKSVFDTIASTFGITAEYLQIPYQDISFHKLWRSRNVTGVISVGECILGDAVLSTGKRTGTPSLAFDNENCARSLGFVSASIPIYRVKIYRRYQCAAHILYQWLSTPRQKSKSQPTPRNPLLPRDPIPSGKGNYKQEYLNCVGADVLLNINEIDPKFPPSNMQLELGKRYLNGRNLTIVTIHRPPFVKLELNGQKVLGAEGFCFEMLDVMAQKFNFTYNLVLPYDGNWGAKMPNGTFNGMVGMVNRHEVDMAIAGFTITYVRETVIDFTVAFYEEPTTILIPSPTEENDFLAFLSPFTWQVWFGTLVSVLAVGSLMSFMANVANAPFLYPHDNFRASYSWFRYVSDCALILAGQGNQMKQNESIRVMSAVWLTVSMIVIYTYTGNLIAFLTVPKIRNLINSLEELANQREVLWTYRAKTAHDELFSTAPAPGTYHKIGQLLKERPSLLVQSDIEGVAAVLRGKMAFIKEKSWLDFAMEKDFLESGQCRLSQVNQLFFSAGFGWALQEECIYLPLINDEILRMMQSGLFTIWREKYWPKPNKCTAGKTTTPTGPRALHLGNFLGHFFLLGVGVGISLLVLAVETIHRPKQQGDKIMAIKK